MCRLNSERLLCCSYICKEVAIFSVVMANVGRRREFCEADTKINQPEDRTLSANWTLVVFPVSWLFYSQEPLFLVPMQKILLHLAMTIIGLSE